MNSPILYWQNILVRLQKLYGLQNETRQHYATSPGNMESYGECTQIRTFKTHSDLFAYLANWLLYTLENGFWGVIERQGGPFLGFAQALTVWINLPEQAPTKAWQRARWLCNYVHGCTSMIHLWSIKSSLSSLYPLCHSRDKLFQALYRFSVLQVTESWMGPGNEANEAVTNAIIRKNSTTH